MKNYLTILFLSVFLTGCGSSFSILGGRDKPKMQMPSKPTKSLSDVETLRSGIDVITDLSHVAYTSGVNAQSYESKTLLSTAQTIQTVAGLPIDKVDWQDAKAVQKMNEKMIKDEKRYREERAKWEAEITSKDKEHSYLINKNNTLSESLESWKSWFWFCVICLVVLCFFFPTIGIPLVKFLVGRAKKTAEVTLEETTNALKGQFGQVVEAIEEYKSDDPEHAKQLLEKLQKKTDSHTRQSINELKRK